MRIHDIYTQWQCITLDVVLMFPRFTFRIILAVISKLRVGDILHRSFAAR